MSSKSSSKFDILVDRVRSICLALPEVSEGVARGHPTFVAGTKVFTGLEVVIPWGPAIRLRVEVGRRAKLLQDSRFFPTPFATHLDWVSMKLHPSPNWDEVTELIHEAYLGVATRRMLNAMDGR